MQGLIWRGSGVTYGLRDEMGSVGWNRKVRNVAAKFGVGERYSMFPA
jgi:hypothetical protein